MEKDISYHLPSDLDTEMGFPYPLVSSPTPLQFCG